MLSLAKVRPCPASVSPNAETHTQCMSATSSLPPSDQPSQGQGVHACRILIACSQITSWRLLLAMPDSTSTQGTEAPQRPAKTETSTKT